MKKYLVLAILATAFSSSIVSARNEPIPPEFPPEEGAQLPEDGPEPDYVGEESYERDPEEGEGGMIGEVFRTNNLPVQTKTKKEDRGDVMVYTLTTQQYRGVEICVTTTVTVVHKATQKVLSSNADSSCYNYSY